MDPLTGSPEPTAPAPSAPVITATFDAASKGDFGAFDKATVAARAGKALPDVPAAPADAKPAAAAPPAPEAPAVVSKRQQDANERVRLAVENATRDLREENERLKASAAPRRDPTAPVTPKAGDAPTVPEWKRIASMPDAPKLADFDTVEDHAAAMAFFVNRTLSTESAAAAQHRTAHEETAAVEQARHESFIGRLNAAKAADPEFATKLTPEVKALKPISGLEPGEPSGPLNILWEQVYDSPHLDKLLVHFSANPQALREFETVPAEIAKLPARQRVAAHVQHILREFGALTASFRTPAANAAPAPSPISAAPPPVPSVSHKAGASSDPSTTAVSRGDFAAFDRAEQAKLRQKRGA